MGFLVRLVLALVVAIAIGIGSAWFTLDNVAETDFAANGAWRIAPDASSTSLGLYERAAAAKLSLLAPDHRETLTLTATADETGAPLVGGCTYRVEGASPPAKAWSIAAYGPKHFLIANRQNRYALAGEDVIGGDGNFVVLVSAADQPGHWLPLDDERHFSLTLRLYEPDARIVTSPNGFNAPRLIKVACR